MKTRRLNTLVIGSGASGLAAALRLKSLGVDDILLFFFNDTATTEIYTLSLHDALPIFHLIYI